MSATKELVRQLIFFSSIMAGFSFASVLQVIGLNKNGKLTSWIIGCLTITTFLMLSSTFIGSLLLTKIEGYQTAEQMPPALLALNGQVGLMEFYMLLGGLVTFCVGMGLTGWLKSRLLGVVSSTCAAMALGIMLWALFVYFPA